MDLKALAKDSYAKAMSNMPTNKGRAFAHYLVALTLCPEWRPQMIENFISLTENVGGGLLHKGRVEDFFKCYEQALNLYPDSPELKRNFANHLSSIGLLFRAFTFYRAAFQMAPEVPLWQRELDGLKNLLVERWHFRMLNDGVRNEAYKNAILSTVPKDSSCLDIGCGSGLLTLLVGEMQPKRLVSVDSNEALYNMAKFVLKVNNLQGVQLLNELSTSLEAQDIGGRVSVVVTETFDAGFFGEGILQTMVHARKQLMQNFPTDIIIPKSGSLFICGVQSRNLAKKHMFVDNHLKESIKFHNIKVFKNKAEPYDTEDLTLFKDLTYVTDVKNIINVNFYDTQHLEDLISGDQRIDDVKLTVECDGSIHAYAVWFELHLTDEISITTDPRVKCRANAWEQAIFYLNAPLVCRKKDEVTLRLCCKSGMLQLQKEDLNDDCFPVPSSIVRILNDSLLVNCSDSAVSAACIHLAQASAFKDNHILDLSSFPITGFLLLSRGIQYLTCVARFDVERRLILRVCELNGIDKTRVDFYDKYEDILNNDGKKFHVIVSSFLNESYGELNIKRIIMARFFRGNRLEKNGLMIPHRIKLMAKLVYSEELERINRVNDKNIFQYKMAEAMNVYTVGQNFISDITSIPYVSMSEDLVLLAHCERKCRNNALDIELLRDGQVNAVICWFEIQMMEDGEYYSTKVEDSWTNCSVHILESYLSGVAKQKGSLLMCCDENGYLRMAVDLE